MDYWSAYSRAEIHPWKFTFHQPRCRKRSIFSQFTLLLAHIPMSPHVCKSKTAKRNAQQQIQRVKYLQPIRKGICMGYNSYVPLYISSRCSSFADYNQTGCQCVSNKIPWFSLVFIMLPIFNMAVNWEAMILRVPHCSLVKFSHRIIYLMAIERGLNPSEYEFTSPFGVSMTSTNGSCSIHSYVYI
jgi:hypothetical protein